MASHSTALGLRTSAPAQLRRAGGKGLGCLDPLGASRRLPPVKKMAITIKGRFDAVVLGIHDHRNDAFVESMNGQFKQAKRPLTEQS